MNFPGKNKILWLARSSSINMTKKIWIWKKNATPGWVFFFTGEFSLTTIRLKFHIQIFFQKGLCVVFFLILQWYQKRHGFFWATNYEEVLVREWRCFLGGIDSRDTHGSFISSQENGRQILGKMSLLHSTVWTRHHLWVVRKETEPLVRVNDQIIAIVTLKIRENRINFWKTRLKVFL